MASAPKKLSALQLAMREKLESARFRFINEQLYTQKGKESFEMMQKDPSLFSAYHQGYRNQVEGWPENPLDRIIDELKRDASPGAVVGDFGCGEARLAATLAAPKGKLVVHSFDLVPANPTVTACDISNVPLKDGALDFAVFCLSLMGTDYSTFLTEARRTLKPGGRLLIAEVQSRFASDSDAGDLSAGTAKPSSSAAIKGGGSKGGSSALAPRSSDADGLSAFIKGVTGLGFELQRPPDVKNQMFVLLSFKKKGIDGKGSEGSESASSSAPAGGNSLKRKKTHEATEGHEREHQGSGTQQAKRRKLDSDDEDTSSGEEGGSAHPAAAAARSGAEKKKRRRKRKDKKQGLESAHARADGLSFAPQASTLSSSPFAGPALKPCIYKRR